VEVSVNYLQFGDREFQVAFATDITKRMQDEEQIRTAVTYLENIIASGTKRETNCCAPWGLSWRPGCARKMWPAAMAAKNLS
jgi:hypothetical protein